MLDAPNPGHDNARTMNRQRYVVLSGSLGVGNLGDDALASAFLAEHGTAYHGVSVLSAASVRSVPGTSLVGAGTPLPASRSVVRLPTLGGRLGRLRALPESFRAKLILNTLADGAPIDYVWLGGLFGLAPHIALRSRELAWASSFASRFIYYFGDAEVAGDAHGAARELAAKLRNVPSFLAVRSPEAAAEFKAFGFPEARVGTDAVLFQYGAPSYRSSSHSSDRIVINPCNVSLAALRPLWLGMAHAAIRRGMRVEWVSFCDAEDLPLCEELRAETTRMGGAAVSTIVRSTEALSALRSAATIVATRFHAHIFGVCFGRPTISVSYGSKTTRLFDQLGLAEWRLSSAGVSASRFDEVLDGALTGGFVVPEAKLAELRSQHQRVVSLFQSSLDAG